MKNHELRKLLNDTCLFTDHELDEIIRTCGKYTIGNAIIACELCDITLTGSDVDTIISASK